ncbi:MULTISPECIES: phosphoglycerate dehydrogenase [Aliivibrio]|uniref:D-3-phosphoglycerate dehydrogenase n=2 Tax=Aliivibrio logei TaxID=688 RepID=A0A1B9NXH0_ALILO|nr:MULTISPECIES: phosphoglycerate dehydrogenase [Aliivibrio]MBB1312905.1 phosphoglycerate dehydrogenase [Aliivibrio sp. SR45-2]OCH20410.1 D-3-phosphoglycerate dehydrogenase [Aliivibrio logei]OEF20135.1 D-3-phosphoglycerate dehydrogenase [Aliivibrio logei 5S-186]
MAKVSLEKEKIKILLLEGLHPSCVEVFQADGYTNIEYHKGSLSEEELLEAVKDVHFIGLRSRTQLTQEVFDAANKLVAVGCFCIGTNQVNLTAAAKRGIPVFNAPFSNTRSVAELVLGQILLLLRGIPEKNAQAHRGIWKKSADSSFEARGKRLGIIGYGHIGTQLGILAENLGMRVYYYDIENKLSLGNATQIQTMSELLNKCDVITLHVPETVGTKDMMGAEEFARMKPGAIFINAARGTVVKIPDLCAALESGHLGGAAIDVFPVEPKTNADPFESPLQKFDNVILTPHVGGSTQEAQENIGVEVAGKLTKYSDNGSTLSSVNFPEVSLPLHTGTSRLLHIHENRPGILTKINSIFADKGINIAAQYLQTSSEMGYVVIDVEAARSEEALTKLKDIEGTIRARILH